LVMSNPQNPLVMVQYAILLDAAEGRTQVIEFNPDGNSLQFMYDNIGCSLVECVQIGVDPQGNRIDAWVDEEGSWSQENIVHLKTNRGQMNLWGNVLIMKSNNNGDAIGFNPGNMEGLEGLKVAYSHNVIQL
jgi:hypothetical protein